MRQRQVWAAWAVGVWLAALVFSTACGHKEGGAASSGADRSPDADRPVLLGASDVTSVTRADLAVGIPISGTLQPAVDIRIGAPLPEVVESMYVKEGQTVRAGEVLARFRTGSLAPAEASTEAQRRIAAADYERMQNLFREGAISRRDLERAEEALRAAEAQQADMAKRLDDATVRAPTGGVIAQRFVQAGNRVAEGDALFRLVNTSELEFEATVASGYVGTFDVGSPVVLSVTGSAAGNVNGRVSRVNATADPATRQVKVYVAVPNSEGRLVGDLFASGRILTAEKRGQLAVPAAAVRQGPRGESFVLFVDAGKIARREVTTGLRDESQGLVEIASGLQENETVITGEIEGLREGQRVEIAGREG